MGCVSLIVAVCSNVSAHCRKKIKKNLTDRFERYDNSAASIIGNNDYNNNNNDTDNNGDSNDIDNDDNGNSQQIIIIDIRKNHKERNSSK